MKLTNYFMTLAAAALAFTACEVEPVDLFSTDPVAPILDTHADVLMTEPTMQEIVTFSWSAARNIGSDVTYTLQASVDNIEAQPATVATTSALAASLTKQEFYTLLKNNFGIPENETLSVTMTVQGAAAGGSCISDAISFHIYANPNYLPPVVAQPEQPDIELAEGNTVDLLSWAAAQIGVGEAVTYSVFIRIASEGEAWTELASGLTDTHYAISAKNFNELLTGMGVEAGGTAAVEFLVKAYSASAAEGLESAVVRYNVTTYVPAAAIAQWSLIGVNGDWDTDYFMTAVDGGLWISEIIDLSGEFKLRFDGGWDANRGGNFTAVGEPFAVENNGPNINVPAGSYCVVYDEVNETVTVQDAAQGWGLIGDALSKGWDGDSYKLLEVAPGVFRSGAVKLAAGGFKFRLDNGWEVNYGGTFAAYGEPFEAVAGGENIWLPDSDVTVYLTLDTNAGTITVDNNTTRFAGRWGVVGVVSGMNWDGDVFMYETAGLWRSVPFRAEGGFKIRQDAAWNADRGGAFAAFGEAFAVSQGGSNIELGDDNLNKNFYLIYDPAAETIVVNPVQ